jgi:hypothetical protein
MNTVLNDPAGAGAAAAVGVAAIAVQVEPFILGIQSGVLFTAVAGALFGLAHTDPERWQKLFRPPTGDKLRDAAGTCFRALSFAFALIANAVCSAWAISAFPHFPGMGWAHAVPAAPLAGLVAFGSQHFIPRAIAAATRWLDRK